MEVTYKEKEYNYLFFLLETFYYYKNTPYNNKIHHIFHKKGGPLTTFLINKINYLLAFSLIVAAEACNFFSSSSVSVNSTV